MISLSAFHFRRDFRGFTELTHLVLGQLPTGDNSPPDKDKAQLLPTRTTLPRTSPHQDQNQPINPLMRTNAYMVGNCPSGELSRYGLTSVFFPPPPQEKKSGAKAYLCPTFNMGLTFSPTPLYTLFEGGSGLQFILDYLVLVKKQDQHTIWGANPAIVVLRFDL